MTVLLTVYEKISPFGCLTMARRCLNPVLFMQLAALAAVIVCLVSARERSVSAAPDHQDLDMFCPYECDCKGFTVDCSDRGLRFVPQNIPSQAKRVDLRQNEITDVEDGSFSGLTHLEELILFQNRLREIRPGMFKGLKNLKTLLLNANNISSIDRDTFAGFTNLAVLSLYDNNIRHIPDGTFNPLEKIDTIHLGMNPFHCDCNLLWMAEYLREKPVDLSEAKCETPRRWSKRKITAMDASKVKCTRADHEEASVRPVASAFSSGFANISNPFPCPENCTCTGNSIKCGSLEMTTSTTTSSSSAAASDEEDLYLDDRSVGPYDANDLNRLSKHLDANSNKLSLLLCQKGRCIPIDDPSMNYECKCKNGFSGPFCEQAPTCQKEVFREYHQEDGCRSKKKVKMAECVGSCGDQCCSAVKTRERAVKMVCENGKIYTKTIEVIEKCACDRNCA